MGGKAGSGGERGVCRRIEGQVGSAGGTRVASRFGVVTGVQVRSVG